MISKQREFILESALKLERNISILLSNILFIDIEKSKTLGYKRSSISFQTKVDLLIDTEFIKNKEPKKFIKFSEMRNKFAHVDKCDTFRECFSYVDGVKKLLDDTYPTSNQLQFEEEYLEKAKCLVQELNEIIKRCRDDILQEIDRNVVNMANSLSLEDFQAVLLTDLDKLSEVIDDDKLKSLGKNFQNFKIEFFNSILEKTTERVMKELKDYKIPKRKHWKELEL